MWRALVILGALMVGVPRTGMAQTASPPPDEARIRLDVNVGSGEPFSESREFRSRFIVFSEAGSAFATYPKPSRENMFVDVGGSFNLNRQLGVGINYSRTSREEIAGLKATIPHPTFYSAAATSTGVTGQRLKHTEASTDFYLAIVPIRTRHLEWRLLGGPTIFSLSADMVNDVLYTQTYVPSSPQQTITITGSTTSEVHSLDWGGHAATDFAYFPTRLVGVGAGVRFHYGTISIDEPLSQLSQEIRAGGTTVYLGLRLRLAR